MPLSFLTPGRTYAATIIGDGAGGLVSEERLLDGTDVLSLPMGVGGGGAVRLRAL